MLGMLTFFLNLATENLKNNFCRYPYEEAGEVPMACVVKRSSRIDEAQVMDFIAKQVFDLFSVITKTKSRFINKIYVRI